MSNKNHFISRLKCPICKSSKIECLYELPYDDSKMKTYLDNFYNPQGGVEHYYLNDAIYKLNSCLQCGLIYQEQIPNDDLMYKLYEEWIDANIVCKEQEQYPLWYYESYSTQIMNLISFFNKNPNELRFLDFGMGWGKWCSMAKAFGCEVYGLELSKSRIDYAKKNGIHVLSYNTLSSYTFDYINTDQVFEHIPNPIETLQHLVQSLKLKGIIRISVPNGNDINDRLEIMDWNAPKGSENSLNAVAPLEHINCFNTETLLYFANQCGLVQIQVPNNKSYYKSDKDFIKKRLKIIYEAKKPSTSLYFQKN